MATTAYCVKCQSLKEMKDEKETTMKGTGGVERGAVTGVCPDCGTRMFKILDGSPKMKERKQGSKIIKWASIILGIFFSIGIISAIGSTGFDFLKDYSANQERKDVVKFTCSKTGVFNSFCDYDESNKDWQYEIPPKTKEEAEKATIPEKRYFTSEEECIDFCSKDMMKIDKELLDEIFSKEMVEEYQKYYPELQKSIWHKITNWLEKL